MLVSIYKLFKRSMCIWEALLTLTEHFHFLDKVLAKINELTARQLGDMLNGDGLHYKMCTEA